MKIAKFIRVAAFFAAAACEICQHCSKDGYLSANLTILKAQDNVLVAVGPPPPPPPRQAPATDAVWEKCREKGCLLSWAMQHDDSEVGPHYDPQRTTAASPYQSLDDLRKWFWAYHPHENMVDAIFDLDRTWGIGSALAALGVSRYADVYDGGENRIVKIEHNRPASNMPLSDQTYRVDDKVYRATGASFGFSVNVKDGVVIGLDRESPREAGKRLSPPITPEELPRLNQFSDVAWLEWQTTASEHNANVKNLRYFMATLVVNRETQSVVLRATNKRGAAVQDWPGHTFERGSREMDAILGTPNMQGFAYMLIQHKSQLGNMYISKIQVFRCETQRQPPCIIAYVSKPEAGPDANPGKAIKRDKGHDMARVHKIFAKL